MECVSTTTFSISLNGQIHGFFKGVRGLRQAYTDDLLLFSKEDNASILLMMDCVLSFGDMAELKANKLKSNTYLGWNVGEPTEGGPQSDGIRCSLCGMGSTRLYLGRCCASLRKMVGRD